MTEELDELEKLLYELAGCSSMCWEPKPTGVFDSTLADKCVKSTATEIRALKKMWQQQAWEIARMQTMNNFGEFNWRFEKFNDWENTK